MLSVGTRPGVPKATDYVPITTIITSIKLTLCFVCIAWQTTIIYFYRGSKEGMEIFFVSICSSCSSSPNVGGIVFPAGVVSVTSQCLFVCSSFAVVYHDCFYRRSRREVLAGSIAAQLHVWASVCLRSTLSLWLKGKGAVDDDSTMN